jgi:hypothetical protein
MYGRLFREPWHKPTCFTAGGIQPGGWGNQAVRRAVRWLHDVPNYPAEGDDTWISWLVNAAYGTSFPAVLSRPGRNIGFTDWTHGS